MDNLMNVLLFFRFSSSDENMQFYESVPKSSPKGFFNYVFLFIEIQRSFIAISF